MKKILIFMMLVMGVNARACLWDVEPNQNVKLTFVETKELTGSYVVLSPLVLTEDSLVMPCLVPGIQVLGQVVYYLDGALEMLDGLLEFFPIKVLADIYEGVDLRGVPFKKADVKKLEILPWEEDLPIANKWITLYDLYGNSGIPDWRESIFTLGADTVMDGKTYRRLLQDGRHYYGAIRYTEDMSKLYYRSHSGEYLLCDFSLSVGDSCALYLNDCPDIHIEQILQQFLGTFTPMWTVINKDWVDGRCHMMLSTTVTEHFEGEEGYTHTISAEMIEGVGSRNVVFLTHSAVSVAGWAGDAPRFSVCAFNDEESLYSFDLSLWGLVNDCPDWHMLTDLNNVSEEKEGSVRKIIHNGKLVIINNGTCYTILGDIIKD